MLPEDDGTKCLKHSLSVLNCNFSKEQSMFPEDDRMVEICLSVLNCNFSKEQGMLPEDDRAIETCRRVLMF